MKSVFIAPIHCVISGVFDTNKDDKKQTLCYVDWHRKISVMTPKNEEILQIILYPEENLQ